MDESVDFDKTQNLFITGDNLEALKLLQESYLNKVDMVYIDPPYNTGHDFIYHDNFHRSQSDEINDSRDDDNNRQYTVNSKENGRYHSDWLSMMYPRLMVARNLLSDRGVIFVSIGETEHASLKMLCDECFGASNFITDICWHNNKKGRQMDLYIKGSYESVLVYAKRIENIRVASDVEAVSTVGMQRDDTSYYKRGYPLHNGTSDFHINNRPNLCYSIYYSPSSGEARVVDEKIRTENGYRLGGPNDIGNKLIEDGYVRIVPKFNDIYHNQRVWRWGSEKFLREYKTELIFTEEKGGWYIYQKKRFFNGVLEKKFTNYIDIDSGAGRRELQQLFGEKVFDNPKPKAMVVKLLTMFSMGNDIILDFFAGSGTTADAIMQLNAEDGGHRKFIMVQLPEDCNEKSEAYKAGYKTIDQLSRERIRRAAKKIKESDKNADDHDYGFRALYIDKANTKDDISVTADSLQQNQLSFQVDDIYADRSPLDLLFGVLVAKGWQLDGEIDQRSVNGNNVYLYDYVPGAGMVACFDNELTDEAINQIIDMHPQVAVFRETAFKQSDEKINLIERFKNDSPETRVWVI